MELVLDIYPLILENINLETLIKCHEVSKFFYNISKKEMKKRLKKIEISINDIYLEKIYLLIENRKIEILDYSIEYLLNDWFCFNFHTQEWGLTYKLCKSINKLQEKKNQYKDIKFLTFKIENDESHLIDID
jgi:hypothetical protein